MDFYHPGHYLNCGGGGPQPHSPSSARCYFNSFLTRHGARRFFQSCSLNAPLLRPTRCQSAVYAAEETCAGVVRLRTRFVTTECGGRNRSHWRLNDWSQMDRTSKCANIAPLPHLKKKNLILTLTYVFTGMHAMQPNRISCKRMRRHPAASDSFIHAVQNSDTSAAANAARFCGKHWRLSHSWEPNTRTHQPHGKSEFCGVLPNDNHHIYQIWGVSFVLANEPP